MLRKIQALFPFSFELVCFSHPKLFSTAFAPAFVLLLGTVFCKQHKVAVYCKGLVVVGYVYSSSTEAMKQTAKLQHTISSSRKIEVGLLHIQLVWVQSLKMQSACYFQRAD